MTALAATRSTASFERTGDVHFSPVCGGTRFFEKGVIFDGTKLKIC
jgi:hypothetical protein